MQKPSRRKIYETATKLLSSGEKFDGEAHGIYGLLKEYLDCRDENVWTDPVLGINMIPNDIYLPNTEYNSPSMQYGDISIDNIKEFEKTYVNTLTQAAQDYHTMYKCITK